MREICNCGREAVVMVGPYSPRCQRHREVGARESTLDWDREHWRWWKTLDAYCIGAGLAVTVLSGHTGTTPALTTTAPLVRGDVGLARPVPMRGLGTGRTASTVGRCVCAGCCRCAGCTLRRCHERPRIDAA